MGTEGGGGGGGCNGKGAEAVDTGAGGALIGGIPPGLDMLGLSEGAPIGGGA